MPETETQPQLEEGLLANDSLGEETPRRKVLWDMRLPVCALCIAVLTQGYLLVSCFPYVAFMCIKLVPGLTEQTAGFYSGTISAMFMVGRGVTSYGWGSIADRFGRKQVFYWSYILSIAFSIWFGMSTQIWQAIVARFFLGASNGLIAVTKTTCTEICDGDKNLEGKVIGFVFGMRGWTFLFSPALGGFLADPVKQFPNWYISTHFTEFFTTFPYILPNLVSVLLCLAGFITTALFVKETRPDEIKETNPDITPKTIWKKPATRDHLIAFWFYVFASLSYDESVPLFCVAIKGGLGLEEKQIGAILSGAGLFYGALQYLLYHQIMRRFGLFGTMKLASTFGTPLAILTPLSIYMNAGEPPYTLNTWTYLFLCVLIGTIRINGGTYYATSSLGANRSVNQEEIAAMNGLSMLGGSVGQAFGPFMAGSLTSIALSGRVIDPNIGCYLTFSVVTTVGITLALFTRFQLKKHHVTPN